jgi:hypothetical protein
MDVVKLISSNINKQGNRGLFMEGESNEKMSESEFSELQNL